MAHIQDAPTPPLGPEPAKKMFDLRTLGGGGLLQSGGWIYEDVLREMQGPQAIRTYKEMVSNDATVSAIVYAIDKFIRQVKWRVDPASSADFDRDAAQFVETCMYDMDINWTDFTGQALHCMMVYGYSLHEICYKRRGGDNALPYLNSQYADGRIGWRDLASRPGDSLNRWIFDDNGRLQGAEQQILGQAGRLVTLPMDKCLLFRTGAEKISPEGRSVLRGAVRSWLIKRGLENVEATGIERDVCGVPVARIPRALMELAEMDNPDPAARKIVAMYRKIVTNLRRDAQEGLVLPSESDESGKPLFDLSLLQSGGSRQFDVSATISRLDRAILRSCMADFLMLGDGAGAGAYSMHVDKSRLFLRSLNTFLTQFCDELNSRGVRKLLRLNQIKHSALPRIVASNLDQIDLSLLSDAMQKLSAAGMPLFPDKQLEDFIRETGGLPVEVTGADETEVQPQDPEHLGHIQDLLSAEDQLPQTADTDEQDNLLR